MSKTSKRYTDEFKREAVALVLGGQRIAETAHNLDVSTKSLRQWVRQHEVDNGRGAEGALTTEERAELARLRRENRTLRMEREILKKATAFFAKENS